jgi:hyperosmotically inducible protein
MKGSRLSTITLSSMFALGCAGGALARQATSPNDESTAKLDRSVADNRITKRVEAELASREGVERTDVSVVTNDGVVTLAGSLEDRIAVKKAVEAAEGVAGVRIVRSAGLKSRD